MILTSTPKPCMNPPHSRAMYDAPTTNVLPGCSFFQKISSETMQSSFPDIPGSAGLPPVAISILSAVIT
jgi:hypothetical protein